jgi:rubrerythrin
MDARLKSHLVAVQRDEITQSRVYERLARREAHSGNREVLERIARDEQNHYEF